MSAVPLPLEPTSWRPPCVHPAAAAIFALVFGCLGVVLVGQGLWIHAKAMLAQVLLERAFAATLATGQVVKPWSWADTWPIARITVPRLGENAIVLHGSSGQALAFGPGHVEGTPDAGDPGTAVYAAHRDTHFAFLGSLKLGDDIRVTRSDGATFLFVSRARRWCAGTKPDARCQKCGRFGRDATVGFILRWFQIYPPRSWMSDRWPAWPVPARLPRRSYRPERSHPGSSLPGAWREDRRLLVRPRAGRAHQGRGRADRPCPGRGRRDWRRPDLRRPDRGSHGRW